VKRAYKEMAKATNSKVANKTGAISEMMKSLTEDISQSPTNTAAKRRKVIKKAQSQALN